jgi:hypothetical protein
MPENRRIATLIAFARRIEALAQDDALDVLFALVSGMVAMSKGVQKKERLRSIKDLDEAALALKEALDAVFDHELFPDSLPLGQLRDEISLRAGGAGRRSCSPAGAPPGRSCRTCYPPWSSPGPGRRSPRWHARRGKITRFGGTVAAEPVLEALDYLRGVDWSSRSPYFRGAPLTVVGRSGRRRAPAIHDDPAVPESPARRTC